MRKKMYPSDVSSERFEQLLPLPRPPYPPKLLPH